MKGSCLQIQGKRDEKLEDSSQAARPMPTWKSQSYNLLSSIWEFSKTRVPYLGVLIIRVLLFRVPLFSETLISR